MTYTDCYYDVIESITIEDVDEEDCITEEELLKMRQDKFEAEYNSPLSMDSLGLSWRDFF